MNRREMLQHVIVATLAARTGVAQSSLRPILVIGATARSAPELLEQALAEGRRVTALEARRGSRSRGRGLRR
jgi:hypothetical protein